MYIVNLLKGKTFWNLEKRKAKKIITRTLPVVVAPGVTITNVNKTAADEVSAVAGCAEQIPPGDDVESTSDQLYDEGKLFRRFNSSISAVMTNDNDD